MKELLYPLAIIIVITLAFGYFGIGFYANNLVQILLVIIGIITILSAFILPEKFKKAN